MSTELEAKLHLTEDVYRRLRADPDLLGQPTSTRRLELQTNLYYDSPGGALRRAGATLRARRVAGRAGVEWTLKSRRRVENAIQTTDELVGMGPDGPDPLELAGEVPPVTAARDLAGASLRLELTATTERLIVVVEAPNGGAIELAIDRLTIPGYSHFVDYELEAESHGASREDVEALAASLTARFGLRLSTETKRARLQAYLQRRASH